MISSIILLTDLKLMASLYPFLFQSAFDKCNCFLNMVLQWGIWEDTDSFYIFSFWKFIEVDLQCNGALSKIKHSFPLQSSFWWNLFQISPMNHLYVFDIFDSFHIKILSSRTDDTPSIKLIVNGSESMERLVGSPLLFQL